MELIRFGELYAMPSGNGLSRPSAVRGNGYRMIGMGELFASDIISDSEMDRVEMSERERRSFLVEKDDLLFARQSLVASGAGKCSVVDSLSEPTTYESHLIRVRLDKAKCNPRFYFYLFKLPENPVKAIVNQCAQAGIRGNELARVKVPLVPRGTQDQIVSVLTAYDRLIAVNTKRIKLLEQMAENLYKEWFVRFRFPGHETAEFANGIPKGWKNIKLFDLAKVTYGYPFSSDEFCDDETKNAVVRIRDVPNNATKTYTAETCADKYLIGENAILVGMDGIFHMCLWNGARAFLNQRVVKIESKTEGFCNYLVLLAITPQVKFWENAIAGTTVAHLGDKHLKRMSVLLPDRKTREIIDPVFRSIMQEKNLLFKKNEKLIMQRDLLLPRLMSGKLEVTA